MEFLLTHFNLVIWRWTEWERDFHTHISCLCCWHISVLILYKMCIQYVACRHIQDGFALWRCFMALLCIFTITKQVDYLYFRGESKFEISTLSVNPTLRFDPPTPCPATNQPRSGRIIENIRGRIKETWIELGSPFISLHHFVPSPNSPIYYFCHKICP